MRIQKRAVLTSAILHPVTLHGPDSRFTTTKSTGDGIGAAKATDDSGITKESQLNSKKSAVSLRESRAKLVPRSEKRFQIRIALTGSKGDDGVYDEISECNSLDR